MTDISEGRFLPAAPRRDVSKAIARRCGRAAVALWLPAALVLAWWLASASSPNRFFPPLSEILAKASRDFISPAFADNLLPSLQQLVLGLSLAVILGLSLGYAVGLSKVGQAMLMPVFDAFRSTPVVALIPVFIGIFGLGSSSTVLVVAWAAFWPILLGTVAGMASVETGFRDTAEALRMNARQKLFMMRLPAAAPHIFAGMDIAVSIAVVAMVAAGLFSATEGLGRYLALSKIGADMSAAYAGGIAAGCVGFGAATAFRLLERRVFMKWHFERGERNGEQ